MEEVYVLLFPKEVISPPEVLRISLAEALERHVQHEFNPQTFERMVKDEEITEELEYQAVKLLNGPTVVS